MQIAAALHCRGGYSRFMQTGVFSLMARYRCSRIPQSIFTPRSLGTTIRYAAGRQLHPLSPESFLHVRTFRTKTALSGLAPLHNRRHGLRQYGR